MKDTLSLLTKGDKIRLAAELDGYINIRANELSPSGFGEYASPDSLECTRFIPDYSSYDTLIALIKKLPKNIIHEIGARETGGDQFAYRIFEFINPEDLLDSILLATKEVAS